MCSPITGTTPLPATTTTTTGGGASTTSVGGAGGAGTTSRAGGPKGGGPVQQHSGCSAMQSKLDSASDVAGAGGGAVKGVSQLGGPDSARLQELLKLLTDLVARLQGEVSGGGPVQQKGGGPVQQHDDHHDHGSGIAGSWGGPHDHLQRAFAKPYHYPAVPALPLGGPMPMPLPKGGPIQIDFVGGAKGDIILPDPGQDPTQVPDQLGPKEAPGTTMPPAPTTPSTPTAPTTPTTPGTTPPTAPGGTGGGTTPPAPPAGAGAAPPAGDGHNHPH